MIDQDEIGKFLGTFDAAATAVNPHRKISDAKRQKIIAMASEAIAMPQNGFLSTGSFFVICSLICSKLKIYDHQRCEIVKEIVKPLWDAALQGDGAIQAWSGKESWNKPHDWEKLPALSTWGDFWEKKRLPPQKKNFRLSTDYDRLWSLVQSTETLRHIFCIATKNDYLMGYATFRIEIIRIDEGDPYFFASSNQGMEIFYDQEGKDDFISMCQRNGDFCFIEEVEI